MRREMIGFTLVELLVVISIIVVLLALLAPSLDQAVYQAELALCGSNQHAIGTGLISYAVANKSWYPDRPQSGYAFDLRSGPKKDHRPTFRKAMGPLNRLLTCPLASSQPLRYEEARGDASNTFQVINTYNIWFGFTFTEDPTARTMRKLGQRFTYLDESFNALASDRDVVPR
jgi:prepilin-type N-terminal cleavage/methylation domain-containing protein